MCINVTDVALAFRDTRITQLYGSSGPLDKQKCDGGQQKLNAPSGLMVARGCCDVKFLTTDTRRRQLDCPEQKMFSIPLTKRQPRI